MVSRAALLFIGVTGLCVVAALLAPTVDAQGGAVAIDGRGFVGTEARCETASSGVAFGRTASALVVICKTGDGYQYRGVRLRDDALLTLAADRTGAGVFNAENDGVAYTFSAKELVVAEGDRVLVTEPMVAYVEPRTTG
ncbi:hypothetical protein SAMN04489835_5709 [Mycolicibacterium rutilum]|uniref:Serine/threonine protein kinase n=1 Tax=Mycolicibacterium rutilum TaxID=370526 RepID=A0A1H6LZQ2_MYCRU|nr:hypothetical protein [Mycolicibacterium rutilum]SEH92031.1 hypothetical protein SAMN04489835_5709 [Mycolicibacterium rutilum]